MYLLEQGAGLDVGSPATLTTTTLRWSTGLGFVTGPAETPANAVYLPLVKTPGNFERHLFARGATSGASEVAIGYVELINDGGLDGLIDGTYVVDGRELTIRRGPRRGAYPADYPVVAALIVERVEAPDHRTIRLVLRDDLALVRDTVVNGEKFAGDNMLPDGHEGTADDIGGQNLPLGYGVYRQAKPVCVNTSKNIWLVSADTGQAAVPNEVSDAGVALTIATQRADIAAMEATAPAVAGTVDWCKAAGEGLYLRFASKLSGTPTVDVTEGDGAADRTPAQIVYRAMTGPGGKTAADFDTYSIADVDAAVPWVCGWWTGAEATIGTLMDDIIGPLSIGCVPDAQGVFFFGRLAPPSGAAGAEWAKWELLAPPELATSTDEGDGAVVWQVTVEYQRIWTTQTRQEIAGAAEDRIAYLSAEYRTVTAEDAAVLTRYPNAIAITVTTTIDAAADAQTFADWLLARDKVKRKFPVLKIPSTRLGAAELAAVVQQTFPRYGWTAGRSMTVLGLAEDYATNTTIVYGYY